MLLYYTPVPMRVLVAHWLRCTLWPPCRGRREPRVIKRLRTGKWVPCG